MANGNSKRNWRRVSRVVDVPLREVSGICLRRNRSGRMLLIAVGDRVAKVAWSSDHRARHAQATAKLVSLEPPVAPLRGRRR